MSVIPIEVGALADVKEWSIASAKGEGARATAAAKRVLEWCVRGGVPASHWNEAERIILRMLLTAADAGREVTP